MHLLVDAPLSKILPKSSKTRWFSILKFYFNQIGPTNKEIRAKKKKKRVIYDTNDCDPISDKPSKTWGSIMT
jgi:hypothetical protein